MKEIIGDYWGLVRSEKPDAIVCTTNMIVKQDGDLVMGAGVAKAFKKRWPGLPREWGTRITEGRHNNGFMIDKSPFEPWLVAFPTKRDWRNKSDLLLITQSARILMCVTRAMGWSKVLMTRPGCGNGGLSWPVVRKILVETVGLGDEIVIVDRGV